MALSIRPFRPDDADRVRELHEVALRDAGTDPHDLPDLSDLERVPEHYRPGGEFLVGDVDGEIVAMGGVVPVDEDTAEIKRMRVDPGHQRRGHGRAILRALEDEARSRGYERIVVTTAVRQDSAPFYRAHGYEETGRDRWEGYELVRLERSLDPRNDR